MDDNGLEPLKMAVAANDDILDSVTKRLSEAAESDSASLREEAIQMMELLNQAHFLHQETKRTLMLARQHEAKMKAMAEERERAVQSLTSTIDVIQKVPDSLAKQASANAGLDAKLDAIAANGVTKDDLGGLKQEMQHIREQIQEMSARRNRVRQPLETAAASKPAAAADAVTALEVAAAFESAAASEPATAFEAAAALEVAAAREAVAASNATAAPETDVHNPDPASLDGPLAAVGDKDTGEREAKRIRTEEPDTQPVCPPQPVQPKLSDDEQRRLAQLTEICSADEKHWKPVEILQSLQALCDEYPVAAKAILACMDHQRGQQWYCVRSVVMEFHKSAYITPTTTEQGDGTCCYCSKNCLQITAQKPGNHSGWWRTGSREGPGLFGFYSQERRQKKRGRQGLFGQVPYM
ncbi:hypothetical protein C8A01DRAFT_34044 [Parachaetomium inaequale]|uniref:Uncharacterized protein n=1 Tax=Parachaetomium inaequale TaxID=2588326 RepID=A0AAN6PJ39_9PEZI|nr:hypothetical protein C8A01DRAFT_34044 [Parachaetomium inaequale]